jgi:hypothetical protein
MKLLLTKDKKYLKTYLNIIYYKLKQIHKENEDNHSIDSKLNDIDLYMDKIYSLLDL